MVTAAACLLGLGFAIGADPFYEPFPAHRVIGNVYYVGSQDLACYLITTPEGHLLINTGFEETVPLIRRGVESLGFKLDEIKIILASHAHSDHVAGHALAKQLTGAMVYVMRGDDKVIASGGEGQYLYADSRWAPCPVDRILEDGEEVKLGGVSLTAHRTPGHTRGCTTWTWQVTEDGKEYNVVVIGSPNVNPGYRLLGNDDYPEIADDFRKTFGILGKLPCDVFLGAHGGYYGMIDKYELAKAKPDKNPFIDPEGYRMYVLVKEVTYFEALQLDRVAGLGAKIKVAVARNPLLTMPFGFDFLPDRSMVVADFGGHRICRVTRTGQVTVIAGDGQAGHQDGPGDQARFNAPHNVVVTKSGDLLVADTSNNCVRRIDGRTHVVSTVAGDPEGGFAGDGGPAESARFNQAYHVFAVGDGFLLADLGNKRIRLVQDGQIRTVAGNGEEGIPPDGALAVSAPLVDPRAVAQDGAGNIWILERSGNALRVVDTEGKIRTVAGTGEAGGLSDGAALSATLSGPKGLWIEPSGNVLIADTDNHAIRRYSPADKTLTTIAGTGVAGKGKAGVKPTKTALDQPHGVGVAVDGSIYIADSHNGRILRIDRQPKD